MPNCSRVEFLERIRVIRFLLRNGYSRQQIIEMYSNGEIYNHFSFPPEKKKHLTKRTCEKEMAMVLRRWADNYEQHLESEDFLRVETQIYIEEMSELKREARAMKQPGQAAIILKEISKMKGITKEQSNGPLIQIFYSGVPTKQIENKPDKIAEAKRLLLDGKEEIVIEEDNKSE